MAIHIIISYIVLFCLFLGKNLAYYLIVTSCNTLLKDVDSGDIFFCNAGLFSDWFFHVYIVFQVEGCGSLVTEERPQSMLIPIELFLTGYAFFQRPIRSLTSSPRSPLSPLCVPAELLSPESLGLKLKPIKTRVSSPDLLQ